MIEKSQDHTRSTFNDLFYACRSAIRSEAGIGILEFLLPLLILDNICFGDACDRNTVINELKEVLSSNNEGSKRLEKMELQKSVASVFMIIEIFQRWLDSEIEEKHTKQRSSRFHSSKQSRNSRDDSKSPWTSDESVVLIEALLNAIPLGLCAKAAYHVGMFAQALQYLEIESRKRNVQNLYELVSIERGNDQNDSLTVNSLSSRSSEGINLTLAHILFGELNDCDSMRAISNRRKQQNIIENIREKEATADYADVLTLSEQASQTFCLQTNGKEVAQRIKNIRKNKNTADFLGRSHLNALLELGHLDSALNHVKGKATQLQQKDDEEATLGFLVPFGVEASWRLGQWNDLEELLNLHIHQDSNQISRKNLDLDGEYKKAIGKTMFALHQSNQEDVSGAIRCAREAIIPSLSVAAGENYIRAYPFLLKLHCLREIEDANEMISKEKENGASSRFHEYTNGIWSWESRLHTVGSNTPALLHVTTTRLALSRLSNNSVIEAGLWLHAGKQARKSGLFNVAQNCLSHADTIYRELETSDVLNSVNPIDISEVKMQLAKMKHDIGNSTEALLMVKQDKFDELLDAKDAAALTKEVEGMKKAGTLEYFCRSALQATEWMVESGLKSGSEVTARYKLLTKISPEWERGEYHLFKNRLFQLPL